jgi:rod shape-determining protein MreD
MNDRRSTGHGNGVIALSFVVALMLTALPMPEWAIMWRPAWVALVLIYWCMALPGRAGVLVGWSVGILLDAMVGTLLGQHALALAVTAFIAHKLHRRVRVLPVWQQAMTVFGLVFVFQALVLWVNGIKGMPVTVNAYLAAPLISMLLWPWVFLVLRDARRRFAVN